MEDLSMERDCECVLSGRCMQVDAQMDMAEGRGESRNFHCDWQNKSALRAMCSYESRFIADNPNARDLSWHKVTVSLRQDANKGWCWFNRS